MKKVVDNMFSKSFCRTCNKETRKWLINDGSDCVSMCITSGCSEQDVVYKDIQNIDQFKFELKIGGLE